jgi:hypothetical protein
MTIFHDVDAIAISGFHDLRLATPNWGKQLPAQFEEGVWRYIELNHRYNSLLWDEEDLARRKEVPNSAIAANKRAIDTYNQKRNDATEKIDEALLGRLAKVIPATDAWHNSETAGSIIDRLSILALKVYAMRLQSERSDAMPEHVATCREKLERLIIQRANLQRCLDTLLVQAAEGRAFWRIYRQFKMYNDPALNPYLYGAKE